MANPIGAPKPPTQFGQYVVQRELGRGGMGVVYLASDVRLERSVALKVLADQVADEPERLARLSREAKSLATLNHPNVASIYGIEEQPQPAGHSRSILVLEYVPGPTLSERLRAGPLPIDEALRIMSLVAGGLEAAHERGLIHRDLKPDNIKITPEGQAKVLDFGLAKAESPIATAPSGTVGVTLAPGSAPSVHTRIGVVMGTPGYMSPEQCRGKPLDKRTDIWSFGCVLFECLTGKQVFTGETISDAIAAVLEREADFDALPARTPPRVIELLHKCLEKDASRRLRDIGDARIELDLALSKREFTPTGAMAAARGPARARQRRWPAGAILAGCAGFLAGVVAGIAGGRATNIIATGAAPARAMRVSVLLDTPPIAAPTVVVSPDGTLLAYPATIERDGRRDTGLAWKRLDTGATGVVKDLARVQTLAIAPDGASIAVTSGGGDSVQIVRLPITEGVPAGAPAPIVRDAPRFSQIAWQNAGTLLVLSPTEGALRRARLDAGALEPVWSMPRQEGERLAHVEAIPGDQWAVVTRIQTRGTELRSALLRVSLTAGTAEPLADGASHARYVEPGLLVYAVGNDLVARPFDASACAFTGEAVPLGVAAPTGRSLYTVSREGTLALPPAALGDVSRTLRIVDPSGVSRALHDKPLPIGSIVVPSPTGDHVALAMLEADPFQPTALRVLDVKRGVSTAVGSGSGAAILGIAWTPDGERLIWSRGELGKGSTVYAGRADGGGTVREVLVSNDRLIPAACTHGGDALIVRTEDKDRAAKPPQVLDLKAGTLAPLGCASAGAREFALSPDGALIAYNAPSAGERSRQELFIERFSASAPGDQDTPRVQVSVDGVIGPARFVADGARIMFVTGEGRIVEASISTEPRLGVGGDAKALGVLDDAAEPAGWVTRQSGQAVGGWSPRGLIIAPLSRDESRSTLATLVTGVPRLARPSRAPD